MTRPSDHQPADDEAGRTPKPDRFAEFCRAKMRDPKFWDGVREFASRAVVTKTVLEGYARTDLEKLGAEPYPEAVDVYASYFVIQESLLTRDVDDVDTILAKCRESLEGADPEAAAFLPTPVSSDGLVKARGKVCLDPPRWDSYFRAVLTTVELTLFHERALQERIEFLLLLGEPELPSKRVFLTKQDEQIRRWKTENPSSRDIPIERITGLSAAAASSFRLLSLKWRLSEANEKLKPRGSYLSEDAPPRQIPMRSSASVGLRKAMEGCGSALSISKAITATYAVFAPGIIYARPHGGLKAAAVNTIERERQRVDPEVIKQVEESIERARRMREFLE